MCTYADGEFCHKIAAFSEQYDSIYHTVKPVHRNRAARLGDIARKEDMKIVRHVSEVILCNTRGRGGRGTGQPG